MASRLLSKLLRDRRIGARRARVEHGHDYHFADEERALARRITDLFEHDGILIFKLNEGAHHVSVNPRRLREVGEIINGTWARSEELGRL